MVWWTRRLLSGTNGQWEVSVSCTDQKITWGDELAGLVDETPSVPDERAVEGFGLVHRPENLKF